MNDTHRLAICGRFFLGAAVTLATAGCAMVPPRSFLDPTKVGMFPGDIQESGIRRVLTAREGLGGIANAMEPTPEDLVPVFREHRIGRGDQVQIGINDLLTGGAEFRAQLQVDPTGYIRIPELGKILVVGMTEQELEQDLRVRLQESKLLPNPVVQVILSFQADRFFSVLGGVRQSGPVPLVRPDLRLLDAMALVGDVTPDTKKIYVIRRPQEAPVSTPDAPIDSPTQEPLLIPPPDIDDDAFQTSLYVGGGGGGWRQDTGSTGQDSRTSQAAIDEFGDVVSPSRQPKDGPDTTPGDPPRTFQPLVYDPTTGETLEAPAPLTQPAQSPSDLSEPFDWDDVPEYELTQRVIEIDVVALKAGDPRQNIVLRNLDVIVVPIDTGVFYLMGEVNRPGVYGFAGREITLKQAIAAAGNLSALAWPSRCEITRREPGTDKQIIIPVNLDRIFAGLEQDVLLKDADVVNVGTDIVAPFLFIIRNSFRFTYGFGFVFDRNFADRYSYGGRINPETLELQRRQQQGLPF